MIKGQKRLYSESNKTFRHLMKVNNITPIDLAKVLGRSREHTFKYLNNWYLLTLMQLVTLAGVFNISALELTYLLTKKQKKLTTEDKKTLLDIVEKNKDMDKW